MYDVAEGFDAYKTYLALKQHFTSDYDYFKYNGKVRANVDAFLKRRDKFFFRKLSKKYTKDELVNFFVSNFIVSDNWIGNLISQESEDNYVQFKKRMESLGYSVRNELHFLFDYCRDRDLDFNKGVSAAKPRLRCPPCWWSAGAALKTWGQSWAPISHQNRNVPRASSITTMLKRPATRSVRV